MSVFIGLQRLAGSAPADLALPYPPMAPAMPPARGLFMFPLTCSTNTRIGKQYTNRRRVFSEFCCRRHSHAITAAAVFPAPVGTWIIRLPMLSFARFHW